LSVTEQTTHRGVAEKLFVILTLSVLLYFTVFRELIQVWSTNEDYGHGFFILPISLYLIWQKRGELLSRPAGTSRWGYPLLVLWAPAYVIGSVGHISTVAYASMLLFITGSCAVLVGGKVLRLILFPVLFLVFMFPIPSELYLRVTNPLMLAATDVSFRLVDMMGIPILRDGNLLTLPNYSMEVVDACSGIRSMIAIMAITLLIGYFTIPSLIVRTVFFFVSIPIAMLGNVFRITTTALLAYFYTPQAAEGFSHTFAGIATFLLSILILFGCIQVVQWYSGKRKS